MQRGNVKNNTAGIIDRKYPAPAELSGIADITADNFAECSINNPNPIFCMSKKGILLQFNRASEQFVEFMGWRKDEKVSSSWQKIIKTAFKNGEQAEIETPFKSKIYFFKAVPITRDNYVCVYGMDITGSKTAERIQDKGCRDE